ncbi:MAG: hypothetical protein ACR2KB_17225 [Chitinophagaceae bacterium]
MDIRIIKIGLLITAGQFLISAGCRKASTPCIFGGYSFAVSSEWSPQNEIYNVGDTILLTSTFPKTLSDLVNPSLAIDYSNSTGIGGSYIFYEFDTTQNKVKGAVAKLEFIPLIGVVNDGDIVPSEQKSITYKESSSNYQFKLKVVLKSKGIFAIFISDLLSRGINGKNCTNAGFSNTLTNTNNNLNLFQYAMNRPPASQYEIDRIYCFRVQ